jgi:dsDNA-specific endonuclease/ATPase MutS2
MLFMSRQDRERLNLTEVLLACDCRSPQGRRLKAAHHYYGPGEREALEKELSTIETLVDFCHRHPKELQDALGLLTHFRDLRGTVAGLEKRRLLDVTELFEIKQAIRLLRKLSEIPYLFEKTGLTIKPLKEIESLLDPKGQGTSGFYLYDEYSEKLAALRQERATLEQQMEDRPEEAEKILTLRAKIIRLEEKEETRVRRMLCDALTPFTPSLSENLEAVGQLDFSLAKARLAIHWGAPKPDILENGETIILVQFFHPLIEEQLLSRGSSYERQTVAIGKGSTVLSGPNMGGKSVTLKALTLSMALIHMGYFPPCDYAASPLFDSISYSSDHFDTTKKGLSSFASEIVWLREEVARQKEQYCFCVIDEPCRGTNPEEAKALVGALCRFFAKGTGCLVIATHYPTPEGPAIAHLRIRGITEEVLLSVTGGTRGQLTDEEAIRRIESLMDYSIETVEEAAPIPKGALKLSEWLGMDRDFLALVE